MPAHFDGESLLITSGDGRHQIRLEAHAHHVAFRVISDGMDIEPPLVVRGREPIARDQDPASAPAATTDEVDPASLSIAIDATTGEAPTTPEAHA